MLILSWQNIMNIRSAMRSPRSPGHGRPVNWCSRQTCRRTFASTGSMKLTTACPGWGAKRVYNQETYSQGVNDMDIIVSKEQGREPIAVLKVVGQLDGQSY